MGFGALLRYMMLNIELSSQLKILFGCECSLVLSILSLILGMQSVRPVVSLALAGAALGVAYLIVYSANAYFGYFNNIQSISLFLLISVAANSFSLMMNAQSFAILAIFGAYLAPDFVSSEASDANAITVYSYYLLISLQCLLMIYLKGWRALAHSSFFFPLVGGLFLGWTHSYYLPSCSSNILLNSLFSCQERSCQSRSGCAD